MVETWQQMALGVLVLLVFTSFVKEWLSPEVVALGSLVICVIIGVLPIAVSSPPAGLEGEALSNALREFNSDALRVFSHPAPITVACMFVLSAALERTGVIEILGNWFERTAGKSPTRMLVMMILIVAGLSGFMNNTPVVVVFLPIVLGICRRKDWTASKYLIPLSYAAIAGGTVTIIGTSTNLVASGIAASYDPKYAFGFFDVTPLGLVFVAVTFVYLLTIGKRLLPDRVTLAALIDSKDSREFITRAFVSKESPLIGQKFIESSIKKMKKARVIDVVRDGNRVKQGLDKIVFEEGDEIIIKGRLGHLMGLSDQDGITQGTPDQLGLEDVRTESAVMMEGIIGPDSTLAGKSLKELNFRQRFGVIIVAVHRRGRNLRERFEDVKLAFGDTLLVQGPARRMQQLFELKDFVNLSEPKEIAIRSKKAPFAISAILAFMVVGLLSGINVIPPIPIVLVALSAAVFVLVTRCIDPSEAYQSIEWKVVFLIIGMLGLGQALQYSGVADILALKVVAATGGWDPRILIALFYLLAAVLTEMVSNNAVAALLTPLGIIVSIQLGVDAKPFIAAVMFGSSASFATPIGYQTNTFVYGAGGYKFGDFFRAGFPLAVILWIVASLLIPVIWPL
ncbi:MAG: SLC13 family permease [Akkermansiaceae bacterium]|jgi:di/tricarboxylate transporter|nr:SLC13 family permease [bacterium]|tara:strand:- start:5553 stop:7424 length:1872 start_codon:yes stop_codon:yes gene_type:complete